LSLFVSSGLAVGDSDDLFSVDGGLGIGVLGDSGDGVVVGRGSSGSSECCFCLNLGVEDLLGVGLGGDDAGGSLSSGEECFPAIVKFVLDNETFIEILLDLEEVLLDGEVGFECLNLVIASSLDEDGSVFIGSGLGLVSGGNVDGEGGLEIGLGETSSGGNNGLSQTGSSKSLHGTKSHRSLGSSGSSTGTESDSLDNDIVVAGVDGSGELFEVGGGS